MDNSAPASTQPTGMLSALCRTYGDLLRRQRTAESAFATWGKVTRRVTEFIWLGGVLDSEPLLLGKQRLLIAPTDAAFEAVQKMHATARLNPYERELLYGFPYVIGKVGTRKIRGPPTHGRRRDRPGRFNWQTMSCASIPCRSGPTSTQQRTNMPLPVSSR